MLATPPFEQGGAQLYPFPAGAFDVAISRTGAMFFRRIAVTHLERMFPAQWP